MALIAGSITGAGIFSLPASPAFYGRITLDSLALTTVGALVLALRDGSVGGHRPGR